MADHHCDCKTQGPALLPVRYAVVPDHLSGSLPGWAASGAKQYPDHDNYHYALRVVRRGFLYIYYPFMTKWDAWSISDDGSLWKQFSPDNAIKKSEPDCRQGTYSQGGKDFITLPVEVMDNDIWIAFSQSPWSAATLERYQKEDERSKRMQCLKASQWLTPASAPCAGEASEGNISAILDYMPAANGGLPAAALLPWGTHGDFRVSHMTGDDSFSLVTKVQPQETLYPWKNIPPGLAASTLQQMKHRGVKADGTPVTPLIFALHDAVGVAHELTGWTNDILALPQVFGEERALEFSTLNLIKGVEQIIAKSAEQNVAAQLEITFDENPIGIEMAYQMYVENERRKHTPESEIMTRDEYARQGRERQQGVMQRIQVADDLAKYKRMLNQKKLDSFNHCCDTLTDQVNEQVQTLIDFRIKWLKNADFISTSQDFYSVESDDNLYYREIIAFAISGLNIFDAGKVLLDEWINAYTTTSEKNLVWRTHFFNNPELMAEGESLLVKCRECNGEPMSPGGLLYFFETNGAKLNKIFKGFEKATAALAKPPAENALLSARVLYLMDQYMATAGSRVFSSTRLGAVLDTTSDAINRTLFSLAAGKTQAETSAFLSKYFGWVSQRRAYLDGVGFFNPARVRAQESLRIASKKFAEMEAAFIKYYEAGSNQFAYKASSIKILVLIFNAVELYNQLEHFKDDPVNYAKISSALLATTGGVADIATPVFEYGVKAGNNFQYLKMVGAGCSLIAAGISFGLDLYSFRNKLDDMNVQKKRLYKGLYFMKILNDVATLANAEGKLMSALISRFGWATEEGTLGVWLGRAAAPRFLLLGVEWVGVLSSWWFALVIMISEYIITEYFSRDDLQNWFEQGIFGNENTLSSDGLKPEKITHLIEKSRNDLMACLRTMSSPQHKKEKPRQIMFWPFFVRTESDDLMV
ncbi:hypothetical protein KI694_01340 [Enterobacter oligotrophicus]|uniref:T6SS effector BTH_I2691 family protein n=1 Tax=Enterobacter oligotrophicus TaxID=2478464 RepID=UPI001C0106D5|nr:T6SS effector BTH_I2691 family protein [Enterobacter oligotrophicus]MBT9424179.1 hypothetical protein [Enterobacter oligotrophicus]